MVVVSRWKKIGIMGLLISLFAPTVVLCMDHNPANNIANIMNARGNTGPLVTPDVQNQALFFFLSGALMIAGVWGLYTTLQSLFEVPQVFSDISRYSRMDLSDLPDPNRLSQPGRYDRKKKKKKKKKRVNVQQYTTFLEWKEACDRLPKYPQMLRRQRGRYANTALTKEEFERVTRIFIDSVRNSAFGQNDTWLADANAPDESFYQAGVQNKLFVHKLVLPVDAQFAVHADIHGDIHSLNECIADWAAQGYVDANNPFRILNPNFYIIFTGDYTDRGEYGAECLYTVMRLKAENPEHVILIRGNHEDLQLNNMFGLLRELRTKFNFQANDLRNLNRIYSLFPAALFIGSGNAAHKDFAVICHGGLEPRFDPRALLADAGESVYQWIDALDISWIDSDAFMNNSGNQMARNRVEPRGGSLVEIGFMWNDLIVDGGTARASYNDARGYSFGKPFVKEFFRLCSDENNALRVMIRGHQHNNEMMQRMLQNHGIYNAWSNNQWSGAAGEIIVLDQDVLVITINVSPCSVYGVGGRYNYDTYIIVTVGRQITDWIVEPHNVIIF